MELILVVIDQWFDITNYSYHLHQRYKFRYKQDSHQ